MKMRRTRVRSLLAGCISCLRCVRTSALTCRSSPQCVPPRAQQSPPLGSRCLAPLAVITTAGTPGFPSAAAQQQQRCAIQGVFSVHIGAGSSLPLPPSPLLRRRAYLSLRRNRAGHQARGTQSAVPSRARVFSPAPWPLPKKNFTWPPLKDAVDALDRK